MTRTHANASEVIERPTRRTSTATGTANREERRLAIDLRRLGLLGFRVLGRGLLALAAVAVGGTLARASQPVRRTAATREGVVLLMPPVEGMVRLPGGRLRLGSELPEVAAAQRMCRDERSRERCSTTLFADEMLAHEVDLSDFWLDRREVTNGEYRRCVEATVCHWPNDEAAVRWTADDRLPATLVTWSDADRYCRWRGARLPTEAEWERAARGLSGRQFPWGTTYGPLLANHGRAATSDVDQLDDSDGYAELAPVASFPAGATREGVFDLAGNAAEWVADWYAEGYVEPELRDPKGPSAGDFRVVRGGSYRDGRAWMRGAARGRALPSHAAAWIGFRCAASAR